MKLPKYIYLIFTPGNQQIIYPGSGVAIFTSKKYAHNYAAYAYGRPWAKLAREGYKIVRFDRHDPD